MVRILSCNPVCEDTEPVALPGNNMPAPPGPVDSNGIPDFNPALSYTYPNAVVFNGTIYRANGTIAPGPFDPDQWTQLDGTEGGQALETEDSPSVAFGGDGTSTDPLTANVVSSYSATNFFPTGPSLDEYLQAIDEALPFSADGRTVVHEIVISRPGPVLQDQIILEYVATKPIVLKANLPDLGYKFRGTAGQSVTLDMFKNDVHIGSLIINSTSISVDFTTDVTFDPNDVFTVSAFQDAAFSNVAVTLQGLRQLDFVA